MPDLSPIQMLVASLGGVCALIVLGLAARDIRAAGWFIAAMLFTSSCALGRAANGVRQNRTWLLPFQENRSELFFVAAALVAVAAFIHFGRLRFNRAPAQAVAFLALCLFAATLRLHHDGLANGAQSIFGYLITIIPLMVLVPAMLRTDDDWLRLMRGIALAGVAWTFGVTVQLLKERYQLFLVGNRLTGIAGNSVDAGVLLAFTSVSMLWLVLNEVGRLRRAFWMAMLGLALVYLTWTGTRTGLALFVIGATGALYSRIGRAIFFLPVVAGVLYGLFRAASSLNIEIASDRIFSLQDTRTIAWTGLLADAMTNPILGTGIQGTRYSENSYLLALVAYGFGGALLLLVLVGVTAVQMLRIWRLRSFMTKRRKGFADLIFSINAMYFAGGLSSWYVISRVDVTIVYLLVMAGMATRLIELATEARAEREAAHAPEPVSAWAPGRYGLAPESY